MSENRFEIVCGKCAGEILKKQPKEFQKAAAKRLEEIFAKESRAFLADEPGLGKTYTATKVVCDRAREYWVKNGARPCFVIYVAPNKALLLKNSADILDEARSLLQEKDEEKIRLISDYFQSNSLREAMCSNRGLMEKIISQIPNYNNEAKRIADNYQNLSISRKKCDSRLKAALGKKSQTEWSYFKTQYITKYYNIKCGDFQRYSYKYYKYDECEPDRIVTARPLIEEINNSCQEKVIVLLPISAELMLGGPGSKPEKMLLREWAKSNDITAEPKVEFTKDFLRKYQPALIIWDEFHRYCTSFLKKGTNAFFEWEKENECTLKQLFVSATPYRTNISGENSDIVNALYGKATGEPDNIEENIEGMMSLPSFEKDFAPLFCGGTGERCTVGILTDEYDNFNKSPQKDSLFEKELLKRMVRNERTRLQGRLEPHQRKYPPEDLTGEDQDAMKQVLCNTFRQSRSLRRADYPEGAMKWGLSLPWILDFSTVHGTGKDSNKEIEYFKLLDPDGRSPYDDLFVYDDKGAVKGMISSLPRQNIAFYQLCRENVSNRMKQLLWVPPTFPLYKVDKGSIFAEHKDYSKLLVFAEYRYLQKGGALLTSDYVTFMNGAHTPENFPPDLTYADKAECLANKVDIFHTESLADLLTAAKESGLDEVTALAAIASPAVCAQRLGLDAEDVEKAFHAYFKKDGVRQALWKWMYDNHYCKEDDWKKGILRYCAEGNLYAVLEEWLAVIKKEIDKGPTDQIREILGRGGSTVHVQTCKTTKDRADGTARNCSFAEQLTGDITDVGSGQNEDAVMACGQAFSSPFWPMVLFAGRGAQEGMDMHQYCRRIMHLTMPRGAVSFEQRNGRIDRYNSLLVRKRIAEHLAKLAEQSEIDYGPEGKKQLFRRVLATLQAREPKDSPKGQLYPNWCFPSDDSEYHFEQMIPMWDRTEESAFMVSCDEMLRSYRGSMGTNAKDFNDICIDLSTME